jgi:hypothetical protein
VDELCSEVRRSKVSIFAELDSKRDRANTINYEAYEFKNKFSEGKRLINLPKNNPLQNIDNIDFNSNNNAQVTSTGHKYSGKKYDNYNNYNSNSSYGNYKNKFDFAN